MKRQEIIIKNSLLHETNFIFKVFTKISQENKRGIKAHRKETQSLNLKDRDEKMKSLPPLVKKLNMEEIKK